MRVLAACSLGGSGHLNPLLPFLRAAERRGDETLVVGPPALEEIVGLSGHRFRPGGEPAEAVVAPIRERLPVANPAEASLLANRVLFGRLATAAMLPGMERVVIEWQPDLVIREPCEYSSAVVAHRLGLPIVQVAISFAEVEAGAIEMASPELEVHRSGLTDELRASRYLTAFPMSLDPSPFATTIRFHEEKEEPRGSGTLEEWWGGYPGPRVYMTFGTVLGHMTIAEGVYRTALKAVADLDVRVLLTVGPTFDPANLGPIPANVRVERWIDQVEVLDLVDVVVCHGGSGTVFGALAAGIPLVVVPVFADQFANGRRIATQGAGVSVEIDQGADIAQRRVISESDAPDITAAIVEVTCTDSYRRQAGRIGAEMGATLTASETLELLLSGASPISTEAARRATALAGEADGR